MSRPWVGTAARASRGGEERREAETPVGSLVFSTSPTGVHPAAGLHSFDKARPEHGSS